MEDFSIMTLIQLFLNLSIPAIAVPIIARRVGSALFSVVLVVSLDVLVAWCGETPGLVSLPVIVVCTLRRVSDDMIDDAIAMRGLKRNRSK